MILRESLKLEIGDFYIPKKNSSKPLGEDAHFVCEEKQTIGVADGVGGWSKKGVDAGEYARELMLNCYLSVKGEPDGCDVDLRRILTEAYMCTTATGSSTACVVTLKDHCLHVVNVGDSGIVLIRKGRCGSVYRSPVQQHYFNCPYQLGSSETSDDPSSAQVFKIAVVPGDVIVMGTDGLFDNLFNHQIEGVVRMGIEEGVDPEQVAWALAEHAFHNSMGRTATPFSQAAKKAGSQHRGGKVDDITVIVAYIVPD